MSANLHIMQDGTVSLGIAQGAEPSWHGMENIILPTDTDDEIIKKCGFNFSLIGKPAGYLDPMGNFREIPGKQIVTRSDTGFPVGVVGKSFQFHQPKEIIDFFLSYARGLGLKLETAGVIGNGARYWAMAATEVEGDLNGSGVDMCRLYALLATAGDGSMTTIADPFAKRIVCNNTFNIAIKDFLDAQGTPETKRGNKQSHRSAFSNELAAEGLGFDLENSTSAFLAQVEDIRTLNNVKVGERVADGFFRALLRPELLRSNVTGQESFLFKFDTEKEREVRGFVDLKAAYTNAPGARPGTARGLWEAVTYFIDHVRGTDDEARLSSTLFGQGKAIKARAWEMVLALRS